MQPNKLLEICVHSVLFALKTPGNPLVDPKYRVSLPQDLLQSLFEYGRAHQLINDHVFQWILESECADLSAINLAGCSRLSDSGLLRLAFATHVLDGLVHLNLGKCTMISDASLSSVIDQCFNLEVLVLDHCLQITDRSFQCLRSKELEELDQILLNFNTIMDTLFDVDSLEKKVDGEETLIDPERADKKYPLSKLRHLDVSSCGRLSDSFLLLLMENVRNLEHLNVSSCNGFGEHAMSALLRSLPKLNYFGASDCLWLTSSTLKTIAGFCPLISSLNLNGSYLIDDEGVIEISKNCKSLKELNVKECNQLTDRSISSLFKNSVPLVALDLCWCGLTDMSFHQMQKSTLGGENGTLKLLKLSWCNQISENGLKEGMKNMPNLISLDLSWQKITDPIIESVIKSCRNLNSLDISSSSDLTTDMLLNCAELSQLRVLNLSWCRRVDDSVISKIAEGCPELRVIDVSLCNSITDAGFAALSKCINLKGILASKCRNLSDLGIIEVVKKCPELLFLNLTEWKITDEGLSYISLHCPYLICIILATCKAITDVGVQLLVQRCRRIQSLSISCCKLITNESIISISKHLFRLQSLGASELPLVSDEGLSMLKECDLLQSISISWCNAITDDSIVEILSHCLLLETVDLSFIDHLTNRSVREAIKRLKFVKQFKLVGCKGVTDESVIEFADNVENFLQEKVTLDVSFCPLITSKSDGVIDQQKKISIIKARAGDIVN